MTGKKFAFTAAALVLAEILLVGGLEQLREPDPLPACCCCDSPASPADVDAAALSSDATSTEQ